jgi:hypothetical protein
VEYGPDFAFCIPETYETEEAEELRFCQLVVHYDSFLLDDTVMFTLIPTELEAVGDPATPTDYHYLTSYDNLAYYYTTELEEGDVWYEELQEIVSSLRFEEGVLE